MPGFHSFYLPIPYYTHNQSKSAPLVLDIHNYHQRTTTLLQKLYPKYCPTCKVRLTKTISTRSYVIRCHKCHYQTSRLKGTPLQGLKLPLWTFGWCLHESMARYPKVLTATEIQRRLGVAKNTATLLKRRLQILASEQMPKMKSLIYQQLKTTLKDVDFPAEDNQDLTKLIRNKPIPQVDTCVLYSTSQRANKGRKRYKNSGLTASIYMSDSLGGEQKGILVNTLSWKGGPVIYDSIPDNRGETLRPLLDKYIPPDIPVFTDEGYKFYYRINRNHRMINHSLKSKDKRYRFSRERWSKNGINIQCVEGHNRNLKYNLGAAHGYIKPKYSTLYLNEYAFWRNVKYYGWNSLLPEKWNGAGSMRDGQVGNYSEQSPSEAVANGVGIVRNSYSQNKITPRGTIQNLLYQPLTLAERRVRAQPLWRNRTDPQVKQLLENPMNHRLRVAADEFSKFWDKEPHFRRAKQKQYAFIANALWEKLPNDGWCSLSDRLYELHVDRIKSYRVLRRWADLGLIELVDRSKPTTASLKYVYDIRKLAPALPDILYVLKMNEWVQFKTTTDNRIRKTYKPLRKRRKHNE